MEQNTRLALSHLNQQFPHAFREHQRLLQMQLGSVGIFSSIRNNIELRTETGTISKTIRPCINENETSLSDLVMQFKMYFGGRNPTGTTRAEAGN